ncbi:hypothetical protein C5B42_01130 [Candidatus Cerribacteria bacterium 'Amazon FNV 2010 28 9']|uniref:Glycosyltransferase 2-like domain-containing protein n=1 Tax=Candidatus Cerribacteria bacterium 'Amazon FNV 2010 28 9' TaxID=2081795 RepID=A0A317JR34_9BACT|nr:MAG: hypothetical protein C5B42_01130 [Candidatus Cerribacteria bacterium 'Amazon FNV 2010 28 9']
MVNLEIIILSYNTSELTLRAAKSALAIAGANVTVVDNASVDDTVTTLESLGKKEKRLKVIALQDNIGFAGGNNVALRESTTPYIMLLNSDAYIEEAKSIEQLLTYMDEHTEVGIVSPRVNLSNGEIDPASHRGFPTPWNAFTYYSGLEKLVTSVPPLNTEVLRAVFGGYHQTWKKKNEIHEVGACTAAAMIIRKKTIDEIGLLDERFFMYGEDLDWCYRCWKKGWKVVYDPHATVIHDKHSSGLKKKTIPQNIHAHHIQKRTHHAFYDAMKLFYDKHYREKYPGFVRSLTFLGISIVEQVKNKS